MKLYAIRRIVYDKIQYFNFCTLDWVDEANFNNFCLCNEDLAKHYAKQFGIEEVVAFIISFEETGRAVI